ncbi:MAG: cyclic pyranopterin monophosphate synthase MoaC [Gammaproteobacteria bacterium]
MTDKLTHIDASGRAQMVDVGDKAITRRQAVAGGRIEMSAAAFALLRQNTAPKGDVLAAARLAAIQAAKKTAELIPLCHILPLESVRAEFALNDEQCAVEGTVTVAVTAKTGAEMEALTGVQIGLLTIYDMLKAVDKGMVINRISLLSKSGGQSGDYVRSDSD